MVLKRFDDRAMFKPQILSFLIGEPAHYKTMLCIRKKQEYIRVDIDKLCASQVTLRALD